jgi:hypothetical protein
MAKLTTALATVAVIVGIVAALALVFSPEAHQARQLDNFYSEQYQRLQLQEAEAWQRQYEPLLQAVSAGAIVTLTGIGILGAGALVYAAGLALVHAAQSLRPEHRYRVRELEARKLVLMSDAQHRHPLPIQTLTYSPHFSNRIDQQGALAEQTEQAPGLPGMIDLASVNHTPTPHSILLALGDSGQPITVSAKDLMHTGLVGATGGGKSNTGRLLLSQLLACGVQCCIADPHFAAYDAESGENWRAIAQRLHLTPAVKAGQIEDLFRWLADEMTRRYELRNAGQRPGAPLVAYVDELPAIVANVPGAMDTLGSLLREGRKVRLYLVTSSQDLLTKTLQTGGEIRENLRSCYYSGGAGTSAVQLLDMSKKDIATYEHQLGQGVVLLRSASTPQATLARVPLASNEGIIRLLSNDAPTMPRMAPQDSTGTAQGQHRDSTPAKVYTAEERRIIDLLLSGAGVNDVLRDVKGIDPARGGRKVQEARAEIEAVIRANLSARAVGDEL